MKCSLKQLSEIGKGYKTNELNSVATAREMEMGTDSRSITCGKIEMEGGVVNDTNTCNHYQYICMKYA